MLFLAERIDEHPDITIEEIREDYLRYKMKQTVEFTRRDSTEKELGDFIYNMTTSEGYSLSIPVVNNDNIDELNLNAFSGIESMLVEIIETIIFAEEAIA